MRNLQLMFAVPVLLEARVLSRHLHEPCFGKHEFPEQFLKPKDSLKIQTNLCIIQLPQFI